MTLQDPSASPQLTENKESYGAMPLNPIHVEPEVKRGLAALLEWLESPYPGLLNNAMCSYHEVPGTLDKSWESKYHGGTMNDRLTKYYVMRAMYSESPFECFYRSEEKGEAAAHEAAKTSRDGIEYILYEVTPIASFHAPKRPVQVEREDLTGQPAP